MSGNERSANDGIDLPSPMAPEAGRTGVALGMVGCLGEGNAVIRATGVDDGFLKGWLGRTRFGENERYMVAAVNVINTM